MSVSIEFDGPEGRDGPFEVASANGWQLLCETCEAAGLASLIALSEEGYYPNTAEISKDLDALFREDVFPSAKVRDTAEGLRKWVGVGAEDESISVVNEDEE